MTLRKTPRFASWLQTKTLDLHSFLQNRWKLNETVKHLNDTKSYSKATTEDLTLRFQRVIETKEILANSYSRFLPPNSLKFLRSLDKNTRSVYPAKFYIIPKIHKSPMAERPIAASNYIHQ